MFNDKSNGLKLKSRDKNGRYFCPPLSSARLNLAQRDWWENHTGDYRCHAHARVWQTSFCECVTVFFWSSSKRCKNTGAKKENIQKLLGALACRRDWRDDSEISICCSHGNKFYLSCLCHIWLEMWWKGGMCFLPAVREEKPSLVYSAWNLSTILHTCLVVKYHNN